MKQPTFVDVMVSQVTETKNSLLRRNLEKRGIQVVKRETRYLTDLPQAFSGVGCKPPPGWNG